MFIFKTVIKLSLYIEIKNYYYNILTKYSVPIINNELLYKLVSISTNNINI